MSHWKTEKFAEDVKKAFPLRSINCTLADCPRFEGCTQVPSQSGPGKAKGGAKIFFVTDTTVEDEAQLGIPSVHPAGKLMREAVIETFLKLTIRQVPYLITKLFRADIKEATPKAFEAKLCFSHFIDELKHYEPEVIAAFGVTCFKALYQQALNKSELFSLDEQTLNKLRGKFFEMEFVEGKKVKVYVAYSPGLVLQTPACYRFLLEDAVALKKVFKPEPESAINFKVEKVNKLETVTEVFEYLDMLHRGLPKKTVVAFDTETENLNRKFNNRFLTWQFSHKEGEGTAFPIEHKDRPLFADPVLKKQLQEKMNQLFNAKPNETNVAWWIGHNIKFDMSVLWGLHGIIPRNPEQTVPWWCTMLGMHWLDENRKSLRGLLAGSPYSLKTLGLEFFHFHFEEAALDKRGDGALEQLTLDQLYQYGTSDAILTRAVAQHQIELAKEQDAELTERLHRPFKETSVKLPKFQRYYYYPASRALAVMECNGLFVKEDHLSYLQGEDSPIWGRMKKIETDIQNLPDVLDFRKNYKKRIGGAIKNASNFEENLWDTGEEELPLLNFNKKEHQFLFFLDFLKLTPLRMSKKTGLPQLNARFLDHYSNPVRYKESPTVKEICGEYYSKAKGFDEKDASPIYNDNPLKMELEYRKLKKLGTSYLYSIEGFLRNPKGDCIDQRVRASFNIHGTDTGRMCLTSQTKILTVGNNKKYLEGVPIIDVKVGDLVYCYDDARRLRIKRVLWSGKMGTKQVVRLHWRMDNNKGSGYLDLTPDHKVRQFNGEYREAHLLIPGDRLLSVSRRAGTINRKRINKYARLNCLEGQLKEHRFVFEQVYGQSTAEIIHHEVVKVEWLQGEVDVYDLEIEDCHNFIANEICVHNSSNNPNMQQLPSGKISYAKEVKNLFQAEAPSDKYPEGTCLIQGDYKTAEVRWAALFSKDSNLIKIFNESARLIEEAILNPETTDKDFEAANLMADLHRRTASLMFGMPPEKVTKSQRQNAKCITFGLLFGMSLKTLAENNGWPAEEAEEKMKKYYEAFPDLEKWLKQIPKDAERIGYVETFMGRRRRLDHLFKIGDWKLRTDGERKAMNSSIQGQSSDGGTIGMFKFMQYIFDNHLEEKWLIQNIVHDSCLVQVPFGDVRKVLAVMKVCFVKGMKDYIETNWNCTLAVPIEMEFEIGLKYGALKAWDSRSKSLEVLLADLDKEKAKVWEKRVGPRKPPKSLNLTSYQE